MSGTINLAGPASLPGALPITPASVDAAVNAALTARATTAATTTAAEANRALAAEALKANMASPTFTGTTAAPVQFNGKVDFGPRGWLEAVIPATESDSQVVIISPNGTAALVLGTETSDNPAAGMGAFALGAFALNNNTVSLTPIYAAYMETRRSLGAGVGQVLELALINYGACPPRSPYAATAPDSTLGLILGPGRGDAINSGDCTIGLLFGGGPTGSVDPRWLTGIAYAPNALRPGAHPTYANYSVAIDLCYQQSMVFRSPADEAIIGYFRSEVTVKGSTGAVGTPFNGTAGGGIAITNTGLALRGANPGLDTLAVTDSRVKVTGEINAGIHTVPIGTTGAGFISYQTAGSPFAHQPGGVNKMVVDVNGNMSLAGVLAIGSGIGAFGHAAPTVQPARAVTLADVIAVLAGAGLTA